MSPCQDFYQHTCGAWLREVEIPADASSIAYAEHAVQARTDGVIAELVSGNPGPPQGDIARLQTFFASCMGAEHDEAHDRATLGRWLDRITASSTPAQLQAVIRQLHAAGILALFSYSGVPDPDEPARHRGELHQSGVGIGLGVATDESAEGRRRRADRAAYIGRVLEQGGVDPRAAHDEAEQVLSIEVALAAASITRDQRFDPAVSNHPTTRAELDALAPRVDWDAYLEMVGHPDDRPLNVTSPDYLRAVDRVLAESSPDAVRAYLRWRVLATVGPSLPPSLARAWARDDADGPAKPRRETCEIATLEALGVELSREFARRVMGPERRAQAREIATHVQATMALAVGELPWLSRRARTVSQRKLEQTDLKVGYPDVWPATGDFAISRDHYLDNVLAARGYERRREWARAQRPRDRGAWEMTVYPNVSPGMAAARLVVVNGFPDVFTNSIILPAASLQPPAFDASAPHSVQYATLGFLVAHELVHVVESYEFDALGLPHPTWSPDDVQAHRDRAECLVEQGDAFELDGVHLDGRNTIEESTADLVGLRFAYQAMMHAPGAETAAAPDDGPSPSQRFFYAYGQRWCTKTRPEVERRGLREQWHPPPRYRVNGPLSNMPEFRDAFSCESGSPMVRPAAERCEVW